jgi:hypothetical protein
MAENRTPREATARKRRWAPAALLPDPNPEPGYTFRWVRMSTMNQADPMNVSSKLREGWEPVKASQHPEIQLAAVESDKHRDNIVIGGLMLCKIPTEMADERDEFYRTQATNQMQSVDNNLMRENDPRMPLFHERKSKVTFGTGT